MNYDKSLIEVWKWKEEVGESLLHLTIKERLEIIRGNARKRPASKKKGIRVYQTSDGIADSVSNSESTMDDLPHYTSPIRNI